MNTQVTNISRLHGFPGGNNICRKCWHWWVQQ